MGGAHTVCTIHYSKRCNKLLVRNSSIIATYHASINEAARQRQTIQIHPEKLNKELPWVGFEPTTLCSLGTRCATRAAQQAGAQIYNTMQLS